MRVHAYLMMGWRLLRVAIIHMRMAGSCSNCITRNLSNSSGTGLQGRPITRRMLTLSKHLTFEILEGNHHDRHIVEGLPVERIFQNALNSHSTLLMHVLSKFAILVVYGHTVPYTAANVFV